MAKHPYAQVQSVGEEIAAHMNEIAALFKPGKKITVLVRTPKHPDGSRDVLITNDTIDDAIAALQTRKTAPTLTGDV